MKQWRVYSCYDGTIKHELQNYFIDRERKYSIPPEIFEKLAEFLGTKGVVAKTYSNYEIYFGYTGRTYTRFNEGKYVTDGLQCDDSKEIILDFSLYEQAHHDTLHYRLIHEMLHVLGISEEDMSNIIGAACVYSYDTAKEFVDELLLECANVYESFKQRVKSIQEKEPELVQKIADLSDWLYQEKGFFLPADELEYIAVWYPISFLPPSVKEYYVLFM